MPYKGLTVLVVDDFATMRNIMRNILRKLEFSAILEAEDGRQALATLKTSKVDLIISDWNMPNMSGLDLLQHVRAAADLKDIPFLLVTAEAQQDNIVKAVQAKVNNYIVKPFTAEILDKKLAALLPKSQ